MCAWASSQQDVWMETVGTQGMEMKTRTAKSRKDAQENGIPDPPTSFCTSQAKDNDVQPLMGKAGLQWEAGAEVTCQ